LKYGNNKVGDSIFQLNPGQLVLIYIHAVGTLYSNCQAVKLFIITFKMYERTQQKTIESKYYIE